MNNANRLRDEFRGTRWIRGGYPYRDERTGFNFDPNHGDIREKVELVLKHRRANPHFYPPSDGQYFDKNFIAGQIETYICQQKPDLCGDGPYVAPPVTNVTVQPSKQCPKCLNVDWKPIYCPTCSGQRITGWECNVCHGKI